MLSSVHAECHILIALPSVVILRNVVLTYAQCCHGECRAAVFVCCKNAEKAVIPMSGANNDKEEGDLWHPLCNCDDDQTKGKMTVKHEQDP